ncbi:uncharacterized protein LOC131228087 [Magnolia sinica]|uniref:uncharacterized protein LOC131228087 n=1 Tax=Magnolia sinica TaxID=86752 RepID=UPI0026594A57|nr:uncharacterized protein LOC131228087 [Magnolia sinica]
MGTLWRASDVNWVAKDSTGTAGGILVAWRPSIWQTLNSWTGTYSFSVILQHINSGFSCLFSSVYGPFQDEDKNSFWEELSRSKQNFEGACCTVGDFNVIKNIQGKSHGRSSTPAMKAFSNWIEDEELVDLPLLGARFTWTTSDHSPIILDVAKQNWGPKPFRFDLSWLKIKGLARKISDWWEGFQVNGFADFKLSAKLKLLKKELKEWNRCEFQNKAHDTDKLLEDLSAFDAQMESDRFFPDSQARRVQLIQEITNKILQKEISWKQKARLHWLKEGDRNTRFFHKMANWHASNNRISSLLVDGIRLEDEDEISGAMISYFYSLLNGKHWRRPTLDGIQFNALPEAEASSLEVPFSEEEIKRAVNSLGADKAPGPNGFLIAFYAHFWEVIKADVLQFFQEFHKNGRISNTMGATFIALIPKLSSAASPKDFRPISLLGGPYNILAKVLASRLAKVIGSLIYQNQCAFIAGRQIAHAALCANELLDASARSGRKYIAYKLDIEKAYDHVDWDFLQYLLKRMGFGDKWRAWMCGFFKSNRGLRQGDPLFPFLFLLVGEAFSRMLSKGQEEGLLGGIEISGLSRPITHIQYADDSLIFSEASIEKVINLGTTIRCFQAISSLKVNMAKSKIFRINMGIKEVEHLGQSLGCNADSLPSSFVGLPLCVGKPPIASWDKVIGRFHSFLSR